jgi:hypothetical protein
MTLLLPSTLTLVARPSSGYYIHYPPLKTPLSKKPFAYLIGCIEGAPDLSTRKGYNAN